MLAYLDLYLAMQLSLIVFASPIPGTIRLSCIARCVSKQASSASQLGLQQSSQPLSGWPCHLCQTHRASWILMTAMTTNIVIEKMKLN